jgi:hypothetical protein
VKTLILQFVFVYTPCMNLWFHSASLGLREWGYSLGLSVAIFLLVETGKGDQFGQVVRPVPVADFLVCPTDLHDSRPSAHPPRRTSWASGSSFGVVPAAPTTFAQELQRAHRVSGELDAPVFGELADCSFRRLKVVVRGDWNSELP